VPRLCEIYPGICLTTEEKARKNLSQVKKNLCQVKENLSQYSIHITKNTHTLQSPHKHTHYKTHSYTHTHTSSQTHTNMALLLAIYKKIIIIIIFLHGLGRLTCSDIDALPSFPRASAIPSSPGFVGEGVCRESGVVHSFEVVDPVSFDFKSHVFYSRDL
jgi:hypothetical protein